MTRTEIAIAANAAKRATQAAADLAVDTSSDFAEITRLINAAAAAAEAHKIACRKVATEGFI
jgi:hypothetical protein